MQRKRLFWTGGLGLFLLMVIFFVGPSLLGVFLTELLTTYLLFSLVALSLDLIWGYTGIISIGHFSFFGIGAYCVGLVISHVETPAYGLLPLLIIAGSAISGFLGYLLSYVFFSLKLRDLFVLITIAWTVVIQKIIITKRDFFGGESGLALPDWVVPTDMSYFFRITLTVVIIVFIICWLTTKSPFGKVLLAIKDSENRAQSLGYNTKMVKVIAFTIGAAIAGLGGGLYAVLVGFISPRLFGFIPSFDAVIWIMIGGLGTLYGSILGTLIVSFTKFYLSGLLLDYWLLVLGFFFIGVVLFFPDGIVGSISHRFKRRTDLHH